MKAVSQKKIMSVAIASIFVVGLSSHNAFSAQVQEQLSITRAKTLGPEAERVISRSAAKVLRQIAQARSTINSGDIDKAKTDVLEIIMQLNVIKTEMPSAKIHNHIFVAREHLNYDTNEEVIDDLVPIEASLVEMADYVPVEKARQHIREARTHLKQGNKEAARKSLDAADLQVIYTEIDLPLSSTEHYVINAQKALNNNNPKEADLALKQAENGVEFLSEIVTMPAIRIQETMGQLLKDYASKDYTAVKKQLAEIDNWLNKMAQSTDSITRDEAGRLKTKIDSLSHTIDQKDNDYTKQLEALWHHSKALAERETDKASIGWKSSRPVADIRADLIDAKQKVAFAENLEFYAQADPEDIFKSLDEAHAILKKVSVLSSLDENARKELNQAIKEMDMIRKNTPAPDHRNLYELVRTRLRGLIYHNY